MDALSWAAVGLLFVAVVFLVLLTAAEAYADAVPVTRNRLAAVASRGPTQEDALRRYMEDRRFLLACLAWGHTATLVGITGMALYVASQGGDGEWLRYVIAGLAVVVVASVVQAFPRLLVVENPDRWTLIVRPINAVARGLFGLPVTLLEAPARAAAARRRVEDEASRATQQAHDLLRLVEMEEEAGVIEEEEREMIRGVIRMVDTQAMEVMVPRTDVVAIEVGATFEEATELIIEKGKSRIPLYNETIDNVVGVVYAKDILRHLASGTTPAALAEIARPAYFIPEAKRVDELLAELRKEKVHFAVVVDEYGGTAGVVTIEDLIEEIVGEIEDEYDVEEAPVEQVSETEWNLDGRVPIEEVNEMFGIDIEHEDFDTVGGLVLSKLGRMPVSGDEVEQDGLRVAVLAIEDRRIKRVRASYTSPTGSPPVAE